MEQSERRLSTASVALLFLLGVAVCAVFFSFGFLLGYKERSFSHTPEVERVTPAGETPPVVNPPPEKEEISAGQEGSTARTPSTVQPPSAGSGQKSEGISSGAKAPAQEVSSGEGHPASQRAAAVSGRDSAGASGSAPPAGIVLQVAAMQARQDAEALVKTLKERGYPVSLATPEDAGANDKFFRVRVGPFASRDEAESVRKKLAAEGFRPFVKR
jgi:DedD protein